MEIGKKGRVAGGNATLRSSTAGIMPAMLGAWGGDIDKKLSILLLRQEPLVQGIVPAQG